MTSISMLLLLSVFLLAAGLCWRFLDPGSLFHILDHPNQRSLHQTAIPRSGGIAIVMALFSGMLLAVIFGQLQPTMELFTVALGIFLLVVIGVLDDHRHVSSLIRLALHFCVALLVLISGWQVDQLELPGFSLGLAHWIAIFFTLVYVIWMINLYNFMDGMDGFAGGMGIIGFSTLALFGMAAGEGAYMLLNLMIGAAVGGFLIWNFPPARMFMGDAGSPVLGYLAAAMSLWGGWLELFPLWIPILVFSPFIVDASWTLLRRMARGEAFWRAHREHTYQRLVQVGWGHKKTVLWSYLLMLCCAISAFLLNQAQAMVQWLGIGGWAVIYIGIIMTPQAIERRHFLNSNGA